MKLRLEKVVDYLEAERGVDRCGSMHICNGGLHRALRRLLMLLMLLRLRKDAKLGSELARDQAQTHRSRNEW